MPYEWPWTLGRDPMTEAARNPRISLVIPAFNEEAFLPVLLDSVDHARGRYARGGDAIQIVVADNASTDDTAAIATAHMLSGLIPYRCARMTNGWINHSNVTCRSPFDAPFQPFSG